MGDGDCSGELEMAGVGEALLGAGVSGKNMLDMVWTLLGTCLVDMLL
jgi:hypothetical protein